MKRTLIEEKSFQFAIRIMRLFQTLKMRGCDMGLRRQILRSGTSIGANVHEAGNAESPADFIHKFGIAQKEVGETVYWLQLLGATGYILEPEIASMETDADELMKLIRSSIITAKRNLRAAKQFETGQGQFFKKAQSSLITPPLITPK